jgi:hypothetical protein
MATKKPRVSDDIAAQDETPVVDLSSGAERPPLTEDGGYTVEGNPIPAGFEHVIPFAMTDQGKWEANQGKPAPSGVQVVRSEWDQMIGQRRDEPWAGHDPVKEAVAKHGEAGMKYRGLSERVMDKRGLRGWEPVKDAKGSNVKIGSLILGKMPKETAERRNAHYRDLGNDALQNASEQFAIDQEKAIIDSGRKGVSPLRRGQVVTDSNAPGHSAVIGFETTRGTAV